MPIRESERARYPTNWRVISEGVRERAGQRCECTGQCGDDHERSSTILPPIKQNPARCGAPNGVHVLRHKIERWRWCTAIVFEQREVASMEPDDWADKSIKIVLTVAHLDHTPEHCEEDNLLAMCQFCHLRMDRDQHRKTAAETRRAQRADRDLFDKADR